mgnify:CR=1 FL=1
MTTASETKRDVTTIHIDRSTHSRLKEIRPYDSMSFGEFVSAMADVWEEHEGE